MDYDRLNELRNVLGRIKKGELKHNQQMAFNGEYACLAGWHVKTNFELPDGYKLAEDVYHLVRDVHAPRDLTDPYFAYYDPWVWSMLAIGLTNVEAELLFRYDSPIAVQEEVIRLLTKNLRFPNCWEIDEIVVNKNIEIHLNIRDKMIDECFNTSFPEEFNRKFHVHYDVISDSVYEKYKAMLNN